MWSSFTRQERNVLVFVLGLVAVGSGWTAWERSRAGRSVFESGKPPVVGTQGATTSAGVGAMPVNAARDGLIDLNTADAAELERLPGIGAARAKDILEYRLRAGRFNSVYELDRVKGIGPTMLAKIAPMVTVESPPDGVIVPTPLPPDTMPAGAAPVATFAPGQPVAAQMASAVGQLDPAVGQISPSGMVPGSGGMAVVPVASSGVAVVPSVSMPPSAPRVAPRAGAVAVNAYGPVNINTASLEELMTLKNIGEVKARAIISHRQTHGAFPTVEALDAVKGIGPATISANRARLTVR